MGRVAIKKSYIHVWITQHDRDVLRLIAAERGIRFHDLVNEILHEHTVMWLKNKGGV